MKTPGLALKPVVLQAPNWIYFPEQWDPKSPWHDLRVRQAANLAIDREGMSQALFLGYCKITNSIIPYTFDFYWQPPAAAYDPGGVMVRTLMPRAKSAEIRPRKKCHIEKSSFRTRAIRTEPTSTGVVARGSSPRPA